MTKRASVKTIIWTRITEEEDQEVQPKKHILKKLEEEDEEEDLHPAVFSSFSGTRVCIQNFQAKSGPYQFFLQGFSDASQKKRHRKERRDGGLRDQTTQHGRCKRVTETLLQDCTVVLNLEGLDIDLSQRVIDYSSGSCYAVGGNLQRVSSYIFIITPAGVSASPVIFRNS